MNTHPVPFAAVALAALALFHTAPARAQTTAVLRTLTGAPTDGESPLVNLVQAPDGMFFGATVAGGANNNGTIFRLRPDGSEYAVLFSFPAGISVPRAPGTSFIRGSDGTLFGTTFSAGTSNSGTLYRINPDGTGFAVIHNFTAIGGSDGGSPGGGLIQGADGNLYGLTTRGSGTSTVPGDGSGTIWRCATDGSGYRVIYSFNGAPNYLNGFEPNNLMQGRDGNLYGTTDAGGGLNPSGGVLFTVKTDGTGFAVLSAFSGITNNSTPAGFQPGSPLVQTADGTIYGTTRLAGAVSRGLIYRMNPDGTGYRVIYSFTNRADGGTPASAFFLGRDGALYGTNSSGGTNGSSNGVAYKIATDGTGFRILNQNPAVSAFLSFGLTQGLDGNLYGSVPRVNANAGAGIVANFGTIFRLTEPAGPVITQQPLSQTIAPGGSVTFSVGATGATGYQWQRNGTNIAGALTSTLTLNALTPGASGTYTVIASNPTDSATSSGAVLLVAAPNPGRLINLSVRTSAGTGAQTLIAGFVIGGTGSKQVLVRAIGPTLGVFGVTGVLADPRLGLFSGSTETATNSGWGGTPALTNAFASVGAFALPISPTISRDAALLSPLAAGGYSAQVVSSSGGTGVALVEAYDADAAASTSRFINLSARTVAGTGAQTLIAGFVLSGNVPRTLLIRGVGPGLNQFGVTGTLANPRLELHTTVNNVDNTVATNAGWAGAAALSAAFTQVGAFALPATSADAALLITLTPGSYTAQVAGVAGTIGVALVEVYEMP